MDTLDSLPAPVGNSVERILTEGPIGMSAAARLCGTFRAGKPTHPSTPTRWATKGVRLPDGSLVRLETVRLSGRLATSRQAITRFVQAQQQLTADAPPARDPALPGPSARRWASEAAAAELRRQGC